MKIAFTITVAIGCLVTIAQANEPDSAKPRLVEVWRVGDDALTTGLRNILENDLEHSSEFTLSSGNKPGTMVINIPTHVRWKKSRNGRSRVTYTVEFSFDGKKIGTYSGSCWDDSLGTCAGQILKDARAKTVKLQ